MTTPELYDVHTNRWSELPNATQDQPVYPFVHQLPDGRVLWAGASEVPTATKTLDVASQTWSDVDDRVIDGASIVNYAPGKFLKAGSAADSGDSGPSAGTAFTLDMSAATPRWQPTGDLAVARSFANLTSLPDGSVLTTGGGTEKSGFDDTQAVLPAERWDPATGAWQTLASMAVPRLYHSTAVLLPDGRVFVSGGGADAGVANHSDVELYSPPYLFKGPRPTITTAPTTAFYATTATIATPDADAIVSVSLLRTGSVTHSFDQNARAMMLPFTRSAGALHVQMPPDGKTAPPGYYMLFVVNAAGVPSIAAMTRLPAPYEGLLPPGAVPVPPGEGPIAPPEAPAGPTTPTPAGGTGPDPAATAARERPARPTVRVLGWRGRRLYVRVGCPTRASSTCRLTLALRTSATTARTLASTTIVTRRGRLRTASLRLPRTAEATRGLILRVTSRTSSGEASVTKRLRAAPTTRRPA